jgi:broad specificity phosphatase PhoE
MTMTVDGTFERHSTTEDNEVGIATGWNLGRLSAAGMAMAEQLGRRRHGEFDAIISSDLRRAVETCRSRSPMQVSGPSWLASARMQLRNVSLGASTILAAGGPVAVSL